MPVEKKQSQKNWRKHNDDEYRQYCILKNLYKKFGKGKFAARDNDLALYFCDGENGYNDREFWLNALTKAGYIDRVQNQNGMTAQERMTYPELTEYNITLNGITFLNDKKAIYESSYKLKKADNEENKNRG